MKKRHYIITSYLSTGVALLAVVGIVLTLVLGGTGSDNSGLRGDGSTGGGGNGGGGGGLAPTPSTPNGPTRYFPPGPYVSVNTATETVVLPHPPIPDNLNVPQIACPWDDTTNLVSWHEDSTWRNIGNGRVPSQDQQDVTLPAGKRVVIREESIANTRLGVITIPATSELIFAPPTTSSSSSNEGRTIEIQAQGFNVQGKLVIGSILCPMVTPVTITLYGERPTNLNLSNPSSTVPPHYKGIHVQAGGELQIHGKRYYHTWTRLARTVEPEEELIDTDTGNNVTGKILMLQESVNWEPGQEVVIVTSALKDSRDDHQNEIRVIQAVATSPPAGVGAVVYLTEPVTYRHVGNAHYQVEVALLTRSVKIQGHADDSEPTDPDPLDCVLPRSLYNANAMGTQCPDTETTGYGGHILVEGLAQVEGVELYRMGQTNVMARYPMHFHLVGDCPDCYFKHSAVHRSYYRCTTIHGTNSALISENVCFDIIGYAFYFEDGVETENTLSFNLAAHVHWLGPEAAHGVGQNTQLYTQSATLTFPGDVTASGFYISNVDNYIIGNAASGGWAGFHFVNLDTPTGEFRGTQNYFPSSTIGLKIDGNTAHSTAFWWSDAGAFYIGGSLEYDASNKLVYQAGRGAERDNCLVMAAPGDCKQHEFAYTTISNSKVFLLGAVGLNSWSGRFNIDGFEAHDTGMILQALARGFWMNRLLHVCRTGEPVSLPEGFETRKWDGSGFRWYDTGQEHIITNTIFRNCGLRSNSTYIFDQYEKSPDIGCPFDNSNNGCDNDSSVWIFNSHSDMQVPEIMQATKNIKYENCGRRFKFNSNEVESVSAMSQNWIDADGTASGVGEPTLIVSGIEGATGWWHADDEAIYEPQAPLWFIKKNDGPKRALASLSIRWDDALHSQISKKTGYCFRDASNCPAQAYLRHLGKRFTPNQGDRRTLGLPVTASADITGLSGGYGWLLEFNNGSPREIKFSEFEIDPDSELMISIPYPRGTTFTITAEAQACRERDIVWTCTETFEQTNNLEEVRTLGNKYHVDNSGTVTFRLTQVSKSFVGNPEWIIPGWDTFYRDNDPALPRVEREGVRLPWFSPASHIKLEASCNGYTGDGKYCAGSHPRFDPDVCPSGYTQWGFDRCCRANGADCKYPGDSY